jgi:MarR family transcriptional regulator, temperature-dependent positive regulator of motility
MSLPEADHLKPAADIGDLHDHSGRLLRRAQQVHYWLWNAEVSMETTSPQFVVLHALRQEGDIDQKTIGERVSLDRSTTAGVLSRLASRKLVQRRRDQKDRRRNLLRLTCKGEETLQDLVPRAVRMNQLLTSVLSDSQRRTLLDMLNRVVEADESLRKRLESGDGGIPRGDDPMDRVSS